MQSSGDAIGRIFACVAHLRKRRQLRGVIARVVVGLGRPDENLAHVLHIGLASDFGVASWQPYPVGDQTSPPIKARHYHSFRSNNRSSSSQPRSPPARALAVFLIRDLSAETVTVTEGTFALLTRAEAWRPTTLP